MHLIRTGLILRVYLLWLKGISIQQQNKKTLVSASINDDHNIPAISEEIGDDRKTSRLTCEYKPEQNDPEFDYDSLLLYSDMKDRSDKDECIICEKQKTCCTSNICADCWNPISELTNYKSPDDSYKEEDVCDEIAESTSIDSELDEYQVIKKYAPNSKINDDEKMFYMERCHCCGDEDILWGQTYCSERCREAIEIDDHECIYSVNYRDCLICENTAGREYNESRTPPPFIQVPQRICGCCADVFSYPPFQYYEYDYEYIPSEDDYDDPEFDIQDIGKTVSSCIDCFCKNSKIQRTYRQNFPLIDNHVNHPLISAVYVLQKMYIYNKIDDLQVWSDMLSYME